MGRDRENDPFSRKECNDDSGGGGDGTVESEDEGAAGRRLKKLESGKEVLQGSARGAKSGT